MDELLFTGDDEGVRDVRGQQALGGRDDDDDELQEFVSTQKPDPDGRTFTDFQHAVTFMNDRADAHAMKAAADQKRLEKQIAAEQERLEQEVYEMGNKGDMDYFIMIETIQAFYSYMRRSPAEKAVINRYIIDYLKIDPKSRSSLVPPYGQPYIPGGVMQLKKGGYKSKSKSKKYRYNKKSKKSKTNKRRRSRSRSRKRSKRRSRT